MSASSDGARSDVLSACRGLRVKGKFSEDRGVISLEGKAREGFTEKTAFNLDPENWVQNWREKLSRWWVLCAQRHKIGLFGLLGRGKWPI